MKNIPKNDWSDFFKTEQAKEYYVKLYNFLENSLTEIFPPYNKIFHAFDLTSINNTKIVILGQDPYHTPNLANGLAFSVQQQEKIPPSLKNIFKELGDDIGINPPTDGNLEPWANQGVLLISSVLTVEKSKPRSHKNIGWEIFTDAAIDYLIKSKQNKPLVFMLWGNDAAKKAKPIKELGSNPLHLVLYAAHPSPLAQGKFFGCKHFSQANNFLIKHSEKPINWQI